LFVLANTVSQIGDRFTQMAFIELLGAEFFGRFAAFGGIAVVFTLPRGACFWWATRCAPCS